MKRLWQIFVSYRQHGILKSCQRMTQLDIAIDDHSNNMQRGNVNDLISQMLNDGY